MAFTYIWHLTMFGGFLALAGRAEAGNRHGALPCLKVTPKSLSQNRSWMYRTFMTGGINPNDPLNPLDNKEHVGFVFFRDQYKTLRPVLAIFCIDIEEKTKYI